VCFIIIFIFIADVKRAMCLVCVPLDVKDTLQCFRETLERRNHGLLTFQHSRTLLLLLLADTQHCKSDPQRVIVILFP